MKVCKSCKTCKTSKPLNSFYKKGKRNGKIRRRSSCIECYRVERKKYKYKPNAKYLEYKRNAKRRGLEFKISKTQFLSFKDKPCRYCGNILEYIGLDRLDNDHGYLYTNVDSCCYVCNSFKHVFEESNFLEHVNKIYSYQIRKKHDEQKAVIKKISEADFADDERS